MTRTASSMAGRIDLTIGPGQIESIHLAPARGAPARGVESAVVEPDHGIVGDWRSRLGSRRQVTLIDGAAIDRAAETLAITIPAGATRRQIVVRGLPLNPSVGKHLSIGEVIMEVAMLCDPCEQMETAIGPGGRAALGDDGGICVRVIQGGEVRVGDEVRVLVD
ncbi:MAG: MOSC domain-containing protein [Chloroflexi bacterium]|nr:MOSC domain-containing protein [Chloroflexota bacterium]